MKKVVFVLNFGFLIFSGFSLLACKSTEVIVYEEPSLPALVEDKSVEVGMEIDEEDAEYSRSTQEVEVPREVFSCDKNSILDIISRLSKIIEEYNYEEWLKFIEPDSIRYWSNKYNLAQASKRLPIKGYKLNNLHDYFRLVFVPSRMGKRIDEIRYVSLDQIKAVQMQESQDVVYYNFVKVGGKWMVKLPPLAISGK